MRVLVRSEQRKEGAAVAASNLDDSFRTRLERKTVVNFSRRRARKGGRVRAHVSLEDGFEFWKLVLEPGALLEKVVLVVGVKLVPLCGRVRVQFVLELLRDRTLALTLDGFDGELFELWVPLDLVPGEKAKIGECFERGQL